MTKRYILLDTNIWVYEALLLRTPLSAALLHDLTVNGSHLLLPEVVEVEVRKQAAKLGDEQAQRAKDSIGRHGALTGSAPKLFLKPHDDVAKERWDELVDRVHRMPMTLEHAQAALSRTVARTPPAGPQGHEFRDCLVWEAALSAAQERPVHLISKDKVFYIGGEYRKGIDPFLKQESERLAHPIYLHEDIADCVKSLKAVATPLNESAYVASIHAAIAMTLKSFADERDVLLGELESHSLTLFITERHNRLSAEFMLRMRATLPQELMAKFVGLVDSDGYVVAEGECFIELTTESATDVTLENLRVFDKELTSSLSGLVFLSAAGRAHSSPYFTPRTLRLPIDA